MLHMPLLDWFQVNTDEIKFRIHTLEEGSYMYAPLYISSNPRMSPNRLNKAVTESLNGPTLAVV